MTVPSSRLERDDSDTVHNSAGGVSVVALAGTIPWLFALTTLLAISACSLAIVSALGFDHIISGLEVLQSTLKVLGTLPAPAAPKLCTLESFYDVDIPRLSLLLTACI